MGYYASPAELKARYEDDLAVAHLTFDEGTGLPDTTVLNEVINGAEGEINSYIAKRYLVPVDVSGDASLAARLKSLTLDFSTYGLELRSGNITESRQTAHDQGVEWLVKISEGKLYLPSTLAPPVTTSRGSLARYGTASTDTDTTKRLFTRETQRAL